MSVNDPAMEAEQQARIFNSVPTLDKVSMERSKSFVNAVQELKNLRPQLHSAAAYCETSYLHSEKKQMVLNNLKDYTIRALVNAVDHLGTVAYKLTDVLEQQTLDISTMYLKVSCMNQKLMACQTYTEMEGVRQQKLLPYIPRHHKHYILPNSINKKTDANFPSMLPPPQSLDKEESRWKKSVASPALQSREEALSNTLMQSFGVPLWEQLAESSNAKPLAAFRSFDNWRQEVGDGPVRSKSMLSAFFVKHKTPKLKAESVL